jgi:SAM-dependent methyltransferase
MIEAAKLSLSYPIIDVGGGACKLVDQLVALGYENLTILDISAKALDHAKIRLGEAAKSIHWIESDIIKFRPQRSYTFWHDRAVFHFLTEQEDRARYLEVLNRSVSPDGYVMIAAFALDGPEQCSGLPVQRYSHESLEKTLGNGYQLLLRDQESHLTPWGKEQRFVYALFKRHSALQ